VSGEIRRLQATLEALYKLETAADARDFVVGPRGRADLERRFGRVMPLDREALWILQEDDEVAVALVLDDEVRDADRGDHDRHAALLEGISHFVYFVDRARSDRPLTLLEMELQAEVDKYLATWAMHHEARAPLDLDDLEERLFVHCRIPERDDPAETARYVAANRLAQRYCGWLARAFLRPDRLESMLAEVRRFWRMGHSDKIAHIESR
jgi:hypothetical protein